MPFTPYKDDSTQPPASGNGGVPKGFVPYQEGPTPEADIQIGGALAGAKAAGREVAGVVDMAWDFTVAPALGALKDGVARVQSAVEGTLGFGKASKETRQQQSARALAEGQATTERFSSPLKKLLGFTNEDTAIGPHVAAGMEKFSRFIQFEAANLEADTHGLVLKEDAESLVSYLMGVAGVKGLHEAPKAVKQIREDLKFIGERAEVKKTQREQAKAQAKAAGQPYVEPKVSPLREAAMEHPRWNIAEDEDQPAVKAAVDEHLAEAERRQENPDVPAAGGMPDPEGVALKDIQAIKEKPGFLQSAEERMKLKAWDDKQASDPGYAKAAEAAAKPGFLRTPEEQAYLRKYGTIALSAAMGLAAWDSLDDKQRSAGLSLAGLAFGMPKIADHISDAAPMGAVLEKLDTTLLTLERLPQKQFEYTRKQVEEQLARQDVPLAEKQMFAEILAKPWERVSAKELVVAVSKAMEGIQLEKRPTQHFAEYGVSNLDRSVDSPYNQDPWIPEGGDDSAARAEHEAEKEKRVKAITHVWDVPYDSEHGVGNHFEDPQYFGHTRSFEENGVRHVIEVQSDYTQKIGKEPSPEEQAHLWENYEAAKKTHAKVNKFEKAVYQAWVPEEYIEAFQNYLDDHPADIQSDIADRFYYGNYLSSSDRIKSDRLTTEYLDPKIAPDNNVAKAKSFLQNTPDKVFVKHVIERFALGEKNRATVYLAEAKSKLDVIGNKALAPLVKNWFKRLVREELHDAAKAVDPKVLAEQIKDTEEHFQWIQRLSKDQVAAYNAGYSTQGLIDNLKQAQKYLKELKAKQAAPRVVRFADADTVAKVEGWQEISQGIELTRHTQQGMRDRGNGYGADRLDDQIERHQALVASGQRFHSEHQGIYDRYRKEGDKFFSQLGGKLVKDEHGHTWWEVPMDNPGKNVGRRVQQFGGADQQMLGILAMAGLGGILGYEMYKESTPVTGALIGAFLGGHLTKAAPAIYKSLKDSPAVKESVKELSDKLYTLHQSAAAHGTDILHWLKTGLPDDYAKYAKEIALHLDDPKKNAISERGKELLDQVITPLQSANRAMLGALEKLGVHVAEIQEDYGFHRIPVGKRRSLLDEMSKGNYPYSRGFSTTAPSMYDRSVWQYVTDSGETLIGITEKGGGVSLYNGKKIVAKGTWDSKTQALKSQGKTYSRERASIEDIEKHTDLEYHKEALLAELDANIRLQQALANAYFLRDFMNMPGFENIGMRPKKGVPIPPGWVEARGAWQLRGMYFEPRIAETLNDFLGDKSMSSDRALAKINRVLVGSMFWNPLPHIANVAVHALQEKGVYGLMSNAKINIRTSLEAYKEVSNLGPKYRAYLREGGAFMYPDRVLGDFTARVTKEIGSSPQAPKIANAFGFPNVDAMIGTIYKMSADSLWKWNDVFMMQGYLEKEARGMPRDKAMQQTERHIPSYRVPGRVLKSRDLSQIMTNPALISFGRYDYGRLLSYGETLKDAFGPNMSNAERAHAMDQLLMLGVIMVAYDQLADPVARWVTGNPGAKAVRYGSATIPQMIIDAWTGEADKWHPIGNLFHSSPAVQLLTELPNNKDAFTGKDLGKTLPEGAMSVAENMLPIKQMNQTEKGKMTPEQFFWAQIGIQSPSEEQTLKKEQRKARRLLERDPEYQEEQRLRKESRK